MKKPMIGQIDDVMARPFVLDYCKRWNIPCELDEDYTYGKAVAWFGGFYQGALRAVCGLFVADETPDDLFVYGFYGDGSKLQAAPLRGLMEFVEHAPFKNKYGYILADNLAMLRAMRKIGWDAVSTFTNDYGQEVVKVGSYV